MAIFVFRCCKWENGKTGLCYSYFAACNTPHFFFFFYVQVEQAGCDSMTGKIPLLEFSCSTFFSLQGVNGKIEVCYFRLFFLTIWIHLQGRNIKNWAFVHSTKMQRSYEKVILKKWEGMRKQNRAWLVTESVDGITRNLWVGPVAARGQCPYWKEKWTFQGSLWLCGHLLGRSQGPVAGCSFDEVSWELLLVLYSRAAKSQKVKEMFKVYAENLKLIQLLVFWKAQRKNKIVKLWTPPVKSH